MTSVTLDRPRTGEPRRHNPSTPRDGRSAQREWHAARGGTGGLLLTLTLVGAVGAAVTATLDGLPAVTAAGITFVTCLVTGSAVGLRLRRRWLDPLHRVIDVADAWEAGHWRTRVLDDPETLPPAAAVAGLIDRLNRLAGRTGKQVESLTRQRGDLRALVDHLPDPILLADTRKRLILLNAPAGRLLHVPVDRALGEPLISIVNDPPILALFDQAEHLPIPAEPDASARHLTRDVDASAFGTQDPRDADLGPAVRESLHRTLRLHRGGSRLSFEAVATRTAAGGVLVVLRDVSTLAAAVQMKADFVANASHELRTPLSAIKIAFETLADVYRDDLSQAERCVTIIDGHLLRLEEMLRDLLDLSRVENADVKPHFEPVSAAELLLGVRSTLAPVARHKGVSLCFCAGDGQSCDDEAWDAAADLTLHTDRRLLDLILKNLVENGVKYTPSGGRVEVRFERRTLSPEASAAYTHLVQLDPDHAASSPASSAGTDAAEVYGDVVVRVRDTGIGIAPDHLDRVFERFYQVDPARSGSAGRGTGLGLAIVKHAAAALGGSVSISSTVGEGTTVTCVLPQSLQPFTR